MKVLKRIRFMGSAMLTLGALAMSGLPAAADTAQQIDAKANAALAKCYAEVAGCKILGERSVGMLIFPEVTKGAIGIGGAYGEGVLRVGGTTENYYNTKSASLGLSLGAEERSEVIMFLTQDALTQFRNSEGWEVGGNAKVTAIDWKEGAQFTSDSVKDPVVGFIFGEKGLMADLSFEGAKIERFVPET